MKHFLKVFFITFFSAVVVLGASVFAYYQFYNPLDDIIKNKNDNVINDDGELSEFEKALAKSKRINVLVVGLEHVRTDTIMVASYDIEKKKADLISVPRDTFYEREGYESAAKKKINSVYQDEEIEGLQSAVEKLLQIPIHKYVTVDYEAVKKGIDALGGVEMDIPFHMKYSDPYDDPPLRIDIPEGHQLLDGQTSLEFLRFRHGYPNGDLGRIEAQQTFVKQTVKKMLSTKLPAFIKEVYPYVTTDFEVSELVALAGKTVGFSMSDLNSHLLPGVGKYISGVSYYIPNYEESKQLTQEMYEGTDSKDNDEDSDSSDTEGKTDKDNSNE